MSANTLPRDINNVLPQKNESVLVAKPVQIGRCLKLITKKIVESLAIEKYKANEKGIRLCSLNDEPIAEDILSLFYALKKK
jgi:hypothetical protein